MMSVGQCDKEGSPGERAGGDEIKALTNSAPVYALWEEVNLSIRCCHSAEPVMFLFLLLYKKTLYE
jgi:hypothetical protein